MSGEALFLSEIAGGAFSDWVYGTSEYNVPSGYTAYAFQPDPGGATIDTAKWLTRSGGVKAEVTVTAAYKSKWIDQSITVGPLIFNRPVTSITLSAGKGMIYCKKNNDNS